MDGADFARTSDCCVLLAMLATLAREGPEIFMPARVHDPTPRLLRPLRVERVYDEVEAAGALRVLLLLLFLLLWVAVVVAVVAVVVFGCGWLCEEARDRSMSSKRGALVVRFL